MTIDPRLAIKRLERWPRAQTVNRETSNFRRREGTSYRRTEIGWTTTKWELLDELRRIRVRDAVLQIAVSDRDIRVDGELRADARPTMPGVVLSFVHPKQGPLAFACDKWTTWQANARGITKALEALRLVERYGITSTGEQYAGWKELPSGTAMGPADVMAEPMSTIDAARIIAAAVSGPHDLGTNTTTVLNDEDFRRYAYRQAVKLAHPDLGAPESDGFLRIQRAMKVLEADAE